MLSTRRTKKGGMGFRSIKAFNLAFLAKQCWRILLNPDSLLSKCLKSRYFPRHDLIHSQVGDQPSFTWRSIHAALWVINKGCLWRVDTGHFINIWENNRLPLQNDYKIWTQKSIQSDLS